MSFDLCVYHSTRPQTDEDAVNRYISYCEKEDLSPRIEPNEKVALFLKELTNQHPQMKDWPLDDIDDCPWNADFDVSEGHAIMPLSFSRLEELYLLIVSLAEKYGLFCVDPQSNKIVTAPPSIQK